MTVYLYCLSQGQRTKIKQVYDFADEYLWSWIPILPSYKSMRCYEFKLHALVANNLFPKADSTVCQPIEGLFNWLIEKTDFKRAGKVRSDKGLLVHVYDNLATGFI
jgi:hypothetical protein